MSFYSSLIFYRPRKPPLVTGELLARFISGIQDLGILENQGILKLALKFGSGIDQDDLPSTWEEYSGTIGAFKEIEWDMEESFTSVEEMAADLVSDRRPIYRAYLSLGGASDEIVDHLKRVGSPENDIDLVLTGWSLELGPIRLGTLSEDVEFHGGWIGLGISGYGYLYPWSTRQLVQRAEVHPRLRELMTLCRSTWPVPREKPNWRTRRQRAKQGELWPYEDPGLHWDWYWGVSESG
jgi:hypothetical protein